MTAVKQATQPINLEPIESTINNTVQAFTYKGVAKNPQVLNALNDAKSLLDDFKKLPADQYHGAEGLDAFKQQIRALINRQPLEARDVRSALGQVEQGIKKQIENKAPIYAKAMSDYSEASDLIDEATRALSLGEKTTADTALRKLQSVMRNNANTNYGARLASVETLEQAGGRPILPQLAGQALSDWTPRGIQRATAPTAGAGLALTGNIPAALDLNKLHVFKHDAWFGYNDRVYFSNSKNMNIVDNRFSFVDEHFYNNGIFHYEILFKAIADKNKINPQKHDFRFKLLRTNGSVSYCWENDPYWSNMWNYPQLT